MLAKSFEYIQQLGKGGTGDTGLFKDLQSGEEVAIKLIKRPLPKVIMPNILREVTIQAELGEGHVNIVEAKEVLLTDHHLCLVMEYAAGNSLTGYVADKWQHAQQTGLFLSEDEARYYFRQFVTAVAYCHAHNVAHRDLKLDNTLLDGKTPGRVKLCDFGFAKQWEESNRNMFTHIGTPVYMSPEQLQDGDTNGQGYLGTAVDVWAAGVLLIVMLLGTFPFDHTENPDPNCKEAHTEVWAQQTKGSWSEVPHIKKAVQKLSAEVKDLLDHILVPKEEERITIPEIEAHPWYRQKLPKEYAAAEEALRKDQARVEAYVSSRSISTAAKAQRDQQLKDIVEQAGQRPAAGGGQLVRIDLREAAVVQNPTSGGGGLADLAEE
jgi:serine/threonine-protein kinase SRK2